MGANGHRRVVITGLGAVTPLGNDVRSSGRISSPEERRPTRSRRSTPRLPGHVRLRGEGLRADAVDRAQAGEAHGPVRADGRGGRAAGAGGRRAEDRAGVRSSRCVLRNRDGRSQVVRGHVRHLARAGPRPGQPLLAHRDHPEHGRQPGLDRTRHEGPALLPVHRLRRLNDGDRRRPRCDPPRACGGHARRWKRGGDYKGRYRRLPALRALSRRNDDPSTRAGRSTPIAMASSWARQAPCSCSRSSDTPRGAARGSTPS